MLWLLLAQFWTSVLHIAPVLLEGNWQNCADKTGYFTAERAFDYCVNSKCQWTLHMGPRDEFALYQYPGPEGEHDHSTEENLLYPDIYGRDRETGRGHIRKTVAELDIVVDIRQAGGSDCDSFYVLIKRQ